MYALLTGIYVLVGLLLMLFVLLQSAQGTDVAGAFGGMGSQAAFGPRGTATFLSKATVVLAIIFMAGSLALAMMADRQGGVSNSVLSGEPAAPLQSPAAPATPRPAAPAPAGTTGQVPGLPPGASVSVNQSGVQPNPGAAPAVPSNALPAQKATGGPVSEPAPPAVPAKTKP